MILLLIGVIIYFFVPQYFSAYLKICGILLALAIAYAFPAILGLPAIYVATIIFALLLGRFICRTFFGVDDIVLWEDPPPKPETSKEDYNSSR
ncbi:MAG: hypothetical protein Q4D38_02940 [Planctomycetia bacterium]|nr:hypothetical protein [Planctomycetia bacterium]